MDEYLELVFKILQHKTIEANTERHLKSSFAPNCPSELANQLREELSQSIQSKNKLESKLDEVASELYDDKNIDLLKNTQNDMKSFIGELNEFPQFSEEAGGMIDNPYLSRNERALAIFNNHFSNLIN